MSELRFDPITQRWSLIAPERGAVRDIFINSGTERVCPFCENNEMKQGLHEIIKINDTNGSNKPVLIVIPNNYPVMRVEGELERHAHNCYDTVSGIGADEIIIDSPRHALKAGDYTKTELYNLITALKLRINDLTKDIRFCHIAAFKNIGRDSGAFIEHPHARLIAMPIIPEDIKKTLKIAKNHYTDKDRCLFCDIIENERKEKSRLIAENHDFIAFCPFASDSPFEIAIYPKKHAHSFSDITDSASEQLAVIIKDMFDRLSALFEAPSISLRLKNAPLKDNRLDILDVLNFSEKYYHYHIEICPSVIRRDNLQWASGITVNPISPEDAAALLREVL